MIKITFKKRNGEIFERVRSTMTPYKIGSTTSMGWEVLDIKYLYDGKYYSLNEYDKIIDRMWKRDLFFAKVKKSFVNIYKQLAYSMILLILFRGFENLVLHGEI